MIAWARQLLRCRACSFAPSARQVLLMPACHQYADTACRRNVCVVNWPPMSVQGRCGRTQLPQARKGSVASVWTSPNKRTTRVCPPRPHRLFAASLCQAESECCRG